MFGQWVAFDGFEARGDCVNVAKGCIEWNKMEIELLGRRF